MRLLLLLLILTCPAVGWAQLLQSRKDSTAADSVYRTRYLALPALGSSPETGFMFGGVAFVQFKPGRAGPSTRTSQLLFSAIYTLKKQIIISFTPTVIWPNERWIADGEYIVTYFPESYWGVGPFTRDSDEMIVYYTEAQVEQLLLKKNPSFFAGPQLRWSRLYNVRFENEEGTTIPEIIEPGGEGGLSFGVGGVARWDLRNSITTPIEQYFVEFSLWTYPEWLGSDYAYTTYQLDARKYYNLDGEGKSVLALQALTRFSGGQPPFYDLSLLGGDIIMRGYYTGRYRDQNAAQFQAELRQHLFWRLGGTVFASTGEVWDRFEEFSLRNYKWTAGAGLRFNLNQEETTNVRIDVGLGKDTFGLYLGFGEAF